MRSSRLSQLFSLQEIKSNDENSTCNIIRISLVLWAFLRLVVSLLWTCILALSTVVQLVNNDAQKPYSRLLFGAIAIVVQLVELAMLVTFIIAGFKKNVKLYSIYYYYCKLTLIIYVVLATVCLTLGYERGHYFGEFYIFYGYFHVIPDGIPKEIVFLTASIFDFGLEILLIFLIKKLINNYQSYGNNYSVVLMK